MAATWSGQHPLPITQPQPAQSIQPLPGAGTYRLWSITLHLVALGPTVPTRRQVILVTGSPPPVANLQPLFFYGLSGIRMDRLDTRHRHAHHKIVAARDTVIRLAAVWQASGRDTTALRQH